MKLSIKRIILPLYALLLGITLSSCSTLNKSECVNADWASIGYQDGFNGHQQSRIGRHREACAEYGIKPVLESYLQGYNKGLHEFCQPFRGYQRGLKDSGNKNICKGDQLKPYNLAYSQGKRIYDLEVRLSSTKTVIKNEIKITKDLKKERIQTESKLINDGLTKHERLKLVQRLRAIDKEQQRSIKTISDNENLHRNLLNKINKLKKSSPYKS